MIWARGAYDSEGCSYNTDVIMEDKRKEFKMSAKLCEASERAVGGDLKALVGSQDRI